MAKTVERVVVPGWKLSPVGGRPSLDTYIFQLWSRRHFILEESRAKVLGSTRGTFLGYAWLIIEPLLNALAFFVIFGVILGTSHGIKNFVGFLLIGVFFFRFTSGCMTQGAGSLRASEPMIRGFVFPRVAIPISAIIRQLLNFVPAVLAMFLLVIIFPPFENVTWRIVLIIPCFAFQVLFSSGIAFVAARICHMVPDLIHLFSLISRFWLYASGVFFSLDGFITHEILGAVTKANPMYSYLTIVRDSFLYGQMSPAWMWVTAAAWGIGMFVLGFIFFYLGEESYGQQRN